MSALLLFHLSAWPLDVASFERQLLSANRRCLCRPELIVQNSECKPTRRDSVILNAKGEYEPEVVSTYAHIC